ncbi:N-acetylmuramoyl-L-alanine amidase [Aliikangiella maris]|uniref:N-acetylmuramoyl-L-alanine amidase n=2 Tax=Aliikangiella maris TaxID=3162458 RepID=A0ABV3MVC0_9GAMM
MHQTGATTSSSTFNSYSKGGHGAHFLIDKKGTIYQTAHVSKKCYHVGKIRSKCYQSKLCAKADIKAITNLLFAKGKSYGVRIKDVHNLEKAKSYPDRYPLNIDSLGIEIVGSYDVKTKSYETINMLQNKSLTWLVGELLTHFTLTKVDVYRHPEVSYKMESEAKSATW